MNKRINFLILNQTFQYPEKPTKQQKKDVKELMAIISRIYPCKECADHFKEVLTRIRARLQQSEEDREKDREEMCRQEEVRMKEMEEMCKIEEVHKKEYRDMMDLVKRLSQSQFTPSQFPHPPS